MAAASLTRQAMVMPHMLLAAPEEPQAFAMRFRRVNASVELAVVSHTEMTALTEVEAMVAVTRPVDVIMAERVALAMLSREESAREVMDAVTVTEAKVQNLAQSFDHLD